MNKTIIWEHFQKCPQCFAELGKPCFAVTGMAPGGMAVVEFADRPHGGRQLRAGYGR